MRVQESMLANIPTGPFCPSPCSMPAPKNLWHHVFKVVSRMLKKAGVQPGELEVAEVHDCFASGLNRAERVKIVFVNWWRCILITHNHCRWRWRDTKKTWPYMTLSWQSLKAQAIAEILMYEAIGLAEPGKGGDSIGSADSISSSATLKPVRPSGTELVKSGATSIAGKIPVNTGDACRLDTTKVQ